VLVSCIRETDNIARAADDSEGWHVARQGGDEFTLLLNDLEQTFVVAHVASRIIEAMTRPLLVAGHNLLMTCSIGISRVIPMMAWMPTAC
jgi:GGDEF domain-containing protein